MEFRQSPAWKSLRPASRRAYEYGMSRLPDGLVIETARGEVARIRDGLSGGNARLFVSVISRLFSFAVDQGYMDYNPVLGMKKPTSVPHKRWPDDLLVSFREAAPDRVRDIFDLAIQTGQRVSDLVRMRNADIIDGVLHVVTTKTGNHVYIPINKFNEIHMTAEQASSVFRHELTRQGILGYVLHGLRKTFAARKAEAGASSEEIAAMLGHSTIQMAHEYVRDAERRRLALNGFRR